jgi:hypothetical protein
VRSFDPQTVRSHCICPTRERHSSRALRGLVIVCAAAGIFSTATGCAKSARAKASTEAKAEDDDRKWELGPTGAAEAAETDMSGKPLGGHSSAGLAMAPPAAGEEVHFLGVVHDLALGPAAEKVAACSCLAVAYGRPNSPTFKWRNGARRTDKDTMAIAISSEAVACNVMVGGKEKTLAPASIAAIEHEDKNIVVVIEEARRGIPVARGVLVKALEPGAFVIIKGRGDVPFGTPIGGGQGACRVAIGQ